MVEVLAAQQSFTFAVLESHGHCSLRSPW